MEHQRTDKTLNDRALNLAETFLGVTCSGVRQVHGVFMRDVVFQEMSLTSKPSKVHLLNNFGALANSVIFMIFVCSVSLSVFVRTFGGVVGARSTYAVCRADFGHLISFLLLSFCFVLFPFGCLHCV